MAIDDDVIGNDPLVNGMRLSVRLRRDFTVTDADRFLATDRRTCRELNPGTSAAEANEIVRAGDRRMAGTDRSQRATPVVSSTPRRLPARR